MANAKNVNSNYVFRLLSLNTTNSNLVSGYPVVLNSISVSNINAAVAYLKLYNKATAPTIGTDTPVVTLLVPGATTGSTLNIAIPDGLYFDTGLGLGLTTALADNSTAAVAANEVVVNLFYGK